MARWIFLIVLIVGILAIIPLIPSLTDSRVYAASFGTISSLSDPRGGTNGTITKDAGGIIEFSDNEVLDPSLDVGSRVCFDVGPTGLAENIKPEADCAPPAPPPDTDDDSDSKDSGDDDSDSKDSEDSNDSGDDDSDSDD